MTSALSASLAAWLPELLLAVGGMAALLAGAALRRSGPAAVIAWAAIGLAAVSLAVVPAAGPAFFGLIVLDPFSQALRWLALGTTGLVALMAHRASDVEQGWAGESLGLIALIGVGLMLMAESAHLLMAVVSMELVGLSSYCLAAMTRDARASEAGLKYLLFGALSSGIMLFGISLLYGLTGELALPALPEAIAALGPSRAGAVAVAVTLILAGLAYKISMVPFHMWTPDVYEGAPVAVAALLSVGPKAAGLALLVRLAQATGPAWEALLPLVLALTLATMTLGNVVALLQSNVKRLLAYSTIGQVGYLLIGFSAGSQMGLEAILVYLTAYLFMNLGAFACVAAVHRATGSESLEAFRGLSARAPALAAAFAIFLLSLAGIPPLLGFIGKFLLFGAALEAGQVWLAVGGIINSAIALYYYVNLIRLMYLHRPERPQMLQPAWPLRLAVGLCAAATLWLGVFPAPLLAWFRAVVL